MNKVLSLNRIKDFDQNLELMLTQQSIFIDNLDPPPWSKIKRDIDISEEGKGMVLCGLTDWGWNRSW